MLAKFGAVVVVLAVCFIGALEAQTVSVRKLQHCFSASWSAPPASKFELRIVYIVYTAEYTV